MHFKEVKGILSSSNGMNLYRGCTHGCIYCDARSKCYNMQHDFEDIEVKSNAVALLEAALKRKRSTCMIGTGAMSDPYMPIEKELKLTRQALECIDKYGFGLAIQTKSDLILRDLDVLKRINEKAKCVVQITLTTADDGLCKIIEPNVCPTSRRIEVLGIMKDAGIPTIVWLTPILPFINDTRDNIDPLVNACIDANVRGILTFGLGLTLREGDREYYYDQLDRHFPGIKQKYQKIYGDRYSIASPNSKYLMDIVKTLCKPHGIMLNENEIFQYMHHFESREVPPQLDWFDYL